MRMTVAMVMNKVAARYGLEVADFTGPRRALCVARPRQLAMYLARQETKQSLPQIGARFNRHHTTVLCGTRRIPELMAQSVEMTAEVEDARRALYEP